MHSLLHFGMLSLVGWTAQAGSGFEFQNIRQLEMRISSGDVKVKGVDGNSASLEVFKKRYDERCRLVIEQRGDLLFIELASRNLYSALCQADFNVKVPKNVDLVFKNGAGDITAEGTAGAMAVETGSGHVSVKAKLSSFTARTGSGDLRVEGLEESASVRTGSGKLRLVYEKTPASGQLEIQSGSGDAVVLFPKRAKVKTKFSAGSGALKNLLGDSPNAPFTVTMKSGSGDLLVSRF